MILRRETYLLNDPSYSVGNYIDVYDAALGIASNDELLDMIFYGYGVTDKTKLCHRCKVDRTFYRVKDRKCYECGTCGDQTYPLAKTVMANSKLPIRKWLAAIRYVSTAKQGASAKGLQEIIQLPYKTVWTMLNKIRKVMSDAHEVLWDMVEVDESYIGGKVRKKGEHPFKNKITIFGMKQKCGRTILYAVKNRDKETIYPIIRKHIREGTMIHSDEHGLYTDLPTIGYGHEFVCHNKYRWANGDVTTNRIEGVWARFKSNVRGRYIQISRKWVQHYLDEFSFKHNRRHVPDRAIIDLMARAFNKPARLHTFFLKISPIA